MSKREEALLAEKNKRIIDLINLLSTPDPERVKVLESVILDAYNLIEGAHGKEKLLDSKVNPIIRARQAATLLKAMIKYPGKTLYATPLEEEKKKKEEPEPPQNAGGTSQNQGQQSAETKKLPEETTRLANTGETTRLPKPKDTVSLEETDVVRATPTIALPETDRQPAEGRTIVQSKTGQTIRQIGSAASSGDLYVIQGTPISYAAARISTGIKKGTKLIVDPSQSEIIQSRLKMAEIESRKKLEQIKKGDFGARLQKEALEDELTFGGRIFKKEQQRALVNLINEQPDVAEDYKDTYKPIAEAIALQQATETKLADNGLLDLNADIEGDAAFRQHVDGRYKQTQNDKIMEQFGPDELPTVSQYTNAAIPVRREVLKEYFDANPKEKNPYVSGVTERLSSITQKLGFRKKAAEVATTKATEKVAANTVVNKGLRKTAESFLSKVGGTIGSAIGPGGTAVGAAIGKLLGRFVVPIFKFIKRHAPDLAGGGLALLGAGFLLGNSFLGAIGATLFGLSLAGGGPAVIGLGIAAFAGAVWTFFMAIFFSAIVLPIIISFVVVIVLLAFILFIINSSGYVTPFAPELATVQDANSNQSFNIQVTKKAVTGSEFNNGTFPLSVEYEITITALNDDLTNIVFNNGYQITQQPLVAAPPTVTIPNPPNTIKKGDPPYTFRYIASYPDTFKDSYVCDTFEVAANSGSTRDSSTATACITIGKSPITVSCPSGWPVALGSGRVYHLTQGFNTYPVGSHGTQGPEEAVDVTRADQTNLRPDDYIVTTHDGTVQKIGTTQFGNRVQVIGVCNGKTFVSYYGHLRDAGFAQGLTVGQQIPKGTRVGLVGNTGARGLAYHVHYAFYPYGGPVFMGNPYLPVNRESIRGCLDFVDCGSIIIQ